MLSDRTRDLSRVKAAKPSKILYVRLNRGVVAERFSTVFLYFLLGLLMFAAHYYSSGGLSIGCGQLQVSSFTVVSLQRKYVRILPRSLIGSSGCS
jgi:hypothetical protein